MRFFSKTYNGLGSLYIHSLYISRQRSVIMHVYRSESLVGRMGSSSWTLAMADSDSWGLYSAGLPRSLSGRTLRER